MKHIFLLLSLTISTGYILAQENISIYNTDTAWGYILYADNNEFCPVSVEITFKLANLQSSAGNKFTFIIPARSKKNFITELKIEKPELNSRLAYTTSANYGDFSITRYDTSYAYFLPFNKGKKHTVSQGYNGKRTHKNENAIDFEMPEGTEICAMRNGVVFEVVQKNSRNCPERDCIKYNNYIRVFHPDGTMAEYTHIKKNGSVVNPGDTVVSGQMIGYSGNTGYSTAPHLHVVVRICNLKGKFPTIKTLFKTGDGSKTEVLTEGDEYIRNY